VPAGKVICVVTFSFSIVLISNFCLQNRKFVIGFVVNNNFVLCVLG
jgi:hypothetical protein